MSCDDSNADSLEYQWFTETTLYSRYGKRACDITGALLLLPLVWILVVFVGLAIKMEDRGPVFFCQNRYGKHGKVFRIVKFRSMMVNSPDLRNADSSTVCSAGDWRLTKVGRLLRKTSIDELPQVFNVIKGDMSFIGPRPNLATRRLCQLEGSERLRLSVRPGLTGFNQAYFRNSSRLEDRYAYDCTYASSVSLLTDVNILIATMSSVIVGRNVHSEEKING